MVAVTQLAWLLASQANSLQHKSMTWAMILAGTHSNISHTMAVEVTDKGHIYPKAAMQTDRCSAIFKNDVKRQTAVMRRGS